MTINNNSDIKQKLDEFIANRFAVNPYHQELDKQQVKNLRNRLIAENYIKKVSRQGAKFLVRRSRGDFKVVVAQGDHEKIADYLIKSEKYGRKIFVLFPSKELQKISFLGK